MPRVIKERRVPTKQELIGSITDIWKFADLINFHGGSKAFGECHKKLIDLRWEGKQVCVIFPRGHLKTTLSILKYLHLIYVNPNIRIFIGTGRKELGQAIMREMQQYLIDPWNQENIWNNRPHYPGVRLIPLMEKAAGVTARQQQRNALFVNDDDETSYNTDSVDKKIIWNQNQIQVLRDVISKDPTVGVGCAGSASTGFHYDVIHIDDMIDFTNYDTETKKEKIDTWKNDLFSVLDPEFFDNELYEKLKPLSKSKQYQERVQFLCRVGDEVGVNGTRYFRWDWYQEIEDEVKSGDSYWLYHEKNIYNNGEDNTDGYLWSERWNDDVASKKRRSMSNKHWYAQYLNKVLVTEDITLTWDSVQFLRPGSLIKEKNTNYWLYKFGDTEEAYRIFPRLVIDPAGKANKNSDYTAIGIGGVIETPDWSRLLVFDLKFGRWTPEQWSAQVIELAQRWECWTVYLESVAFSFTLSTYIKQASLKIGHQVMVKEYTPPRDKSKKERIEAGLQPLIFNKGLYLPAYCGCQKELIDMFNLFPSDTVKDDPLDVIEMIREIGKPVKSHSGKPKAPARPVNKMFGGLR